MQMRMTGTKAEFLAYLDEKITEKTDAADAARSNRHRGDLVSQAQGLREARALVDAWQIEET